MNEELESKPRVSRGMHYATLGALITSNIAVLILGGWVAAFTGQAWGTIDAQGELMRMSRTQPVYAKPSSEPKLAPVKVCNDEFNHVVTREEVKGINQNNPAVVVDIIEPLAPQMVRAGSLGVTLGKIRLTAICDTADLDTLTISIEDGGIPGTANGNYQDSTKAYVYSTGSLLADVSIPSTQNYSWYFPDNRLLIPKGASEILTIRSDMSTISSVIDDSPGTPAADIRIGFKDAAALTFSGIGANLDNASYTPTDTRPIVTIYKDGMSSSVVMHKSYPLLAHSTQSNPMGAVTHITNGAVDLFKFRVAAVSGGNEVLLYRTSFGLDTSQAQGMGIRNCNIKDGNGSQITAYIDPSAAEAGQKYVSFIFDDPDLSAGGLGEAMRISAGSSETFTLNCTISNANKGSVLGISLTGDDTSSIVPPDHGTPNHRGLNYAENYRPSIGTNASTTPQYIGNFVWSDNYKNHPLVSGNGYLTNATSWGQWYNGYLVQSLGGGTLDSFYYISWPS